MVDGDTEKSESSEKALEQRASTFAMSDRDSCLAISDMDFVLSHATKGPRFSAPKR